MRHHLVIGAVTALALGASASAGPPSPEGGSLFAEARCTACHAVASVHIASTSPAPMGPDLSTVGDRRDEAWLEAYLTQQELQGARHPTRYAGTEAQRRAIVAWLAALKAKK